MGHPIPTGHQPKEMLPLIDKLAIQDVKPYCFYSSSYEYMDYLPTYYNSKFRPHLFAGHYGLAVTISISLPFKRKFRPYVELINNILLIKDR
jgi:hypothetical protein